MSSRSDPWDRWDLEARLEVPIQIEISPLLQDGATRPRKFSQISDKRAAGGNEGEPALTRQVRTSLGQRMLSESLQQMQQGETQPLAYWQVSNSNNIHGNNNGVLYNKYKSLGTANNSNSRSRQRKTRQHIQTELQTLSSHMTWIFLLFPAGLALLALLVPATYSEDISYISTLTALSECPSPDSAVHCAMAWEHSKLLVQPTRSVNACKFLQLTMALPLSALHFSNSHMSQDDLGVLAVSVSVYLSESPDLDASIDSPLHDTGLRIVSRTILIRDYLSEEDVAALGLPSNGTGSSSSSSSNSSSSSSSSSSSNSSSGSVGQISADPMSLARNVTIPLIYESFDLPGVMSGKARYATATIGISLPRDSVHPGEDIGVATGEPAIAAPIFASLTVKLAVQSVAYTVVEICLRTVFALISLLLLFFSCVRIYLYLQSSSATTCKDHIESVLPEQFSSILMLLSLFVYQSPLCATTLICALNNVSIKDSFLLFAGFTEELAQYALCFCSLAYLDGLKCAPGERYVEARQHRPWRDMHRKGPNPPLFIGQLRDASPEAESPAPGERSWSGGSVWSDAPSRSAGARGYQADGFSGTAEMGAFRTTGTGTLLPTGADSRDSSLRSDRDTSLTRDGSLTRDASLLPPLLSTRKLLLLSAHHPLSKDFLDFLWPKVLLLLSSWASSVVFWDLKYSSVSARGPASSPSGPSGGPVSTTVTASVPLLGISLGSLGDDRTLEVLLIIFGTLSRVLVAVWIVCIVRTSIRTEKILRTTKFFSSRFRQMAFRLLSFQVYLALFVFFVVGTWRLLECVQLVLRDGGILCFGLSDLSSIPWERVRHVWLIYASAGYLAPFGSFRLIMLLFLSSLCVTIAYTLMPAVRDRDRDKSFASSNFLQSLTGLGHSVDGLRDLGQGGRRGGDEIPVVTNYDRTHAFIALESDFYAANSQAHTASGDTSHVEAPTSRGYQMFCLETALILMELSYQSYYRPEMTVTNDGRDVAQLIEGDSLWGQGGRDAFAAAAAAGGKEPGPEGKSAVDVASPPRSGQATATATQPGLSPKSAVPQPPIGKPDAGAGPPEAPSATPVEPQVRPKMDLHRLNMKLLSVFYGSASTFGFMAESQPSTGLSMGSAARPKRIVVCFRGTDNQDNVLTDLTVTQCALPQMRFRSKIFRKKLVRCLHAVHQPAPDGAFRSANSLFSLTNNFVGRDARSRSNSRGDDYSRSASLDPLDILRDGLERGPQPGNGLPPQVATGEPARQASTDYLPQPLSSTPRRPIFSPQGEYSDSSTPYQTPMTPLTPSPFSAASPPTPFSTMAQAQVQGDHNHRSPFLSSAVQTPLQYLELDARNRSGTGGNRAHNAGSGDPRSGAAHGTPLSTVTSEGLDARRDDNLCSWLRGLISRLPVLQQTLPLTHKGFWDVYASMRVQVLGSVLMGIYNHTKELRAGDDLRHEAHGGRGGQEEEDLPLQICFCGHSLGGALAVLAALDISTNLGSICRAVRDKIEEDSLGGPDPAAGPNEDDTPVMLPALSLYTFGSPRVGNQLFCSLVKKRLQTYYRVELEGDSITMMPPNYLGFYKHCGRGVVVDPHGSGSIIVKPTIVETVLLSKSSYSVANHSLDSYRMSLEACFEPEELLEYQMNEYCASLASPRAGAKHFSELPSWLTEG